MDLGIARKTARWSVPAPRGWGVDAPKPLAAEGVHLVMNASGAEALEETAARESAPRPTGVEVVTVPADTTKRKHGRTAGFWPAAGRGGQFL